MKNIMADIETMSTKPDAAIIAIGAVAFDLPGKEILDRFYTTVDLASSMAHGGVVDASTILWWMRQSSKGKPSFSLTHLSSSRYGLRSSVMTSASGETVRIST